MPEPDALAVGAFLKSFKRAVRAFGLKIFEDWQSLADLGLTKSNCSAEILALNVEDYCDGPTPDLDRPGFLWVFGTVIGRSEVYIKLKLVERGDTALAKCISFHATDRPMHYPFRENAE